MCGVCFLNLDNPRTPAVLIVLDNVTTARPEFKKYWQINTLNPPERTADGVLLRNSALGLSGTVSVRMLRPQADQRVVEILSGAAVQQRFWATVSHRPSQPKPKPMATG